MRRAVPPVELVRDPRGALGDPNRKDVQRLARLVDQKIMQPLRPLLGEASQIFISPDGALAVIPFETLVDEQRRYLVERYSFTYLSSGRDLLRLQVQRKSKSEPIILANPSFGEPIPLSAANARAPKWRLKPPDSKRQHSPRPPYATVSSELEKIYFVPLAGSDKEAQVIKSLFAEARVLTGNEATESALKRVAAPRMIHLATHGFFFRDPATSVGNESGDTKLMNPLLRSGLALAGANLRRSGDEDGILTALEASGLNLWGTKLVTLSACDTGLGEIRTGEGVYGLRRAFVLAGAETLVMSLWPVSDYITRRLMTGYYERLKRGLGRRAALREAQLEMISKKEHRHPFYWASFIQSGEWANLDGQR